MDSDREMAARILSELQGSILVWEAGLLDDEWDGTYRRQRKWWRRLFSFIGLRSGVNQEEKAALRKALTKKRRRIRLAGAAAHWLGRVASGRQHVVPQAQYLEALFAALDEKGERVRSAIRQYRAATAIDSGNRPSAHRGTGKTIQQLESCRNFLDAAKEWVVKQAKYWCVDV